MQSYNPVSFISYIIKHGKVKITYIQTDRKQSILGLLFVRTFLFVQTFLIISKVLNIFPNAINNKTFTCKTKA